MKDSISRRQNRQTVVDPAYRPPESPSRRARTNDGTVVTDAKGRPVSYRIVAEEMRAIKKKMKHEKASYYKTHGLRKNATIELYLAGCDDEMVKASPVIQALRCSKSTVADPAKRAREARSRGKKSNGTKQDRNVKVSTVVSKMAVKERGNDASH